MTKQNSVGATFKVVPMKLRSNDECWVLVTLASQPPEEISISRYDNSFRDSKEAERWIDEHMEDLDYRVSAK